MAFFRQLQLLLRHRLLLRRRQICILGLQVFWPAIVFFAVLIFRLKFPPEFNDTCYYHSRGLPSVGGVNFFQSLVCTIHNPCLNESNYSEVPTFPGSRIHKLIDNVSPLLTDPGITSVIHDLPAGIGLMSTLVDTISQPEIRALLEQGLPVSDFLKDTGPERLRNYLNDIEKDGIRISLATDSLQLLVNSNINVIKLSQLTRASSSPPSSPQASSSSAIESILCSPSQLSQVFILSDSATPSMLSKSLCRLNKKHLDGLVQLTLANIDYVKTVHLLAKYTGHLDLVDLSSSFIGLTGLIEELAKKDLMIALDNVFYGSTTLPTSSTSSFEFGLTKPTTNGLAHIAESLASPETGLVVTIISLARNSTLNYLVDHLSSMRTKVTSNGDETSPIGLTLTRLLAGLDGVRHLSEAGLFSIKYRIHELLKNVEAVKILMEHHLGIDIETIEAILNSTIDFTSFVETHSIDANLLCNRTLLTSVLEVPKSPITDEVAVPVDITCHALCTLSIAENYQFSDAILKQLAVRKVIDNLIVLIGDEILGKAQLSRSQVPSSLKSLRSTASAMTGIKNFIHNFTSTLNLDEEFSQLDFQRDGIDLLATPQAADMIGKTMCGHRLPKLTDEFQNFNEAKVKTNLNEVEMLSLPSEFCRDGYRQIMQLNGGPVFWAWLKPLLSGKILYSPDNPLTQTIMSRMNGTFSFMSVLIETLEDWSHTLKSLELFYHQRGINDRLRSVQHLIVQLLGQDMKGLFSDAQATQLVERLANSGGVLKLVRLMGNIAQCFELQRFIGFKDEADLEEAARLYTHSHELIAGVVFLNLNDSSDVISSSVILPKKVEYKIRADIDFVPTTKALKDRIWEPGSRDHYTKHLGYFRGFVQVQEMIDRSITAIHINSSDLIVSPSVHLQQMPYSCYKKDKFGFFILALTPVISTVAWIFLIAFLIRDLVLERELHLEEYLRVTGLKASVAWVTWFLLGFSCMIFGCICNLTIYKMANLLPHSNMVILYFYFIAFSFSIIMYCYLMSCFFRTATIASLSGIVAYLATYLPFMVAMTFEHEMPFINKLLSCLSMSTSFCFGIMYLARYETQGVGIQWTNIWQSPMSEDTMSFASAGIMLIVDGCLYFLIAWYISNVHPPGCNGHREPWYFFLLPSYWGLVSKKSQKSVLIPNITANIASSGGQKKFSLEKGWLQKAGMSLHNLYVIYNKGSARSEHRAVSNLSLELKEGQITTLLGRNGAGKTTTISVLTGQLRPTSGSVFVYGHPVPDEFNEARKLLGYCPQYNVLFDTITVREHLKFFASLKGLLPNDQIDDDVDSMLHATGLWSMQHELACNLSGGLQRRLCVALAFVGGSKLIILDEPTASVDPVARRSIWDLIVKQKNSRTVLLTTHHMDEADILSDQVAVIHRGKLLCSGSPLLLRSKYGCGYQLTISRQSLPSSEEKEANDSDSGRASNEPPNGIEIESTSGSSDSERLLAFIKCLIPNASLIDDHSQSEVILALPRTGPDGTSHDYATFFRCLDANIHNLGFGSYGLTSTTLEEVFLTLCNSEENGIPLKESTKLALSRKLSKQVKSISATVSSSGCLNEAEMSLHLDSTFGNYGMSVSPAFVDGTLLKFMQLWALLSKRALHTLNDWKSLFCNAVLPCIFIALAMGMTCIKPSFAPDPILPLSPLIYGPSTTSFFHLSGSNVQTTHQMYESIVHQMLSQNQRSTWTCLKPRPGWKVAKCPVVRGNPLLPPSLKKTFKVRNEICRCNSSCPRKANIELTYDSVPTNPINTELGFVYNISSVDSVPNFLMNTFPMFNDFRYGGYSFHDHYNVRTKTSEPTIKVWFDNNGYHALSSYLNALDNAIMRSNLAAHGLNPKEYSIVTYSHPFHIRSAQLGDQSVMQRAGDAGVALIILVGFVFIPTSFVFYIVRERTQDEKQLQKIFGVGPVLYWTAAILWDTLSILVSALLCGLIIYSFHLPIYTARLNLPAILLLLFLFGWAMTNLVYLMEKLFKESSIAFMVIYCLSLFVGINTMVLRLLIDVFHLLEVSSSWLETFNSVVLIFPPYALMSGLVDITKNQLFTEIYSLFGQDAYVNPFSMEMLGPSYIYLASEGVILFTINLLYEIIVNSAFFHWLRRPRSLTTSCTSSPSSSTAALAQYEDCDVAEECRRVTQTDGSLFDILRVIEVTKIFKSMFGTRLAVNNVSFGVPRGECFGLLGVNGAGKTTLFKMLTGQLQPTSGKTYINNKSIESTLSSNRRTLGYCPQSDALDLVLTPRQHLMIYARLRGIPSLHRARIVSESLTKFQLTTHSDMPVSALSRGTRRKLCLALSMLGNPSLVLLDEPTSGMDPMSRRCLWQNIQDSIKERRSVLLTSHSMEECDILCSRLAIMVNGRFRCIGSPQYLKHKFGTGYTITLRINLAYSNSSDAINYMKQSFPTIILRAHHHNMLEFSLPTNDILLSDIFASLQSAITRLHLQDFSVSQTTLDQVFVSFANQQVNDYHHHLSTSPSSTAAVTTIQATSSVPAVVNSAPPPPSTTNTTLSSSSSSHLIHSTSNHHSQHNNHHASYNHSQSPSHYISFNSASHHHMNSSPNHHHHYSSPSHHPHHQSKHHFHVNTKSFLPPHSSYPPSHHHPATFKPLH